MRDAVGGTFMIKLLLIFLAVYTIFIALAINYAKAFRVKNKILDIIEQNEGIKNYEDTTDPALNQIDTYIGNIHYWVNTSTIKDKCEKLEYDNEKDLINSDKGYCIATVEGDTASYYKVTTFVTLSIPVVKLEYTIPISGETRKIEKVE